MRSHGVVRFGVLVAVLALLSGPRAGMAQEVGGAATRGLVRDGRFVDRALLASAGAFTGLVVAGYGVWLLRDGPSKCDLCWEATAASAVGGILGGALATTLADGEMPNALVGSAVGAAVGSLVLAVLDRTVDMGPGAMTFSFAIPYSTITAYLARP